MSKKKKEIALANHGVDIGMNYLKSLEEDPKYQVEVDPEGLYNLSSSEKEFIRLYLQYRSLPMVAQLMDLDAVDVKDYFSRYAIQQEIRRISAALYHRQVATNIIAFEDLGSYLTSMLMGTDLAAVDQLKSSEKIQVVKLLMDWHKQVKEFTERPEILTVNEIEEQVRDLSIANIKQLLSTQKLIKTSKNTSEEAKTSREEALKKLSANNLSKEEIEYLESLSLDDLLKLLKD